MPGATWWNNEGGMEWWRHGPAAHSDAAGEALKPPGGIEASELPFWALLGFTFVMLLAPQERFDALASLLEIQEVEGDAVFALAADSAIAPRKTLLDVLDQAFGAFKTRQRQIEADDSCGCRACRSVGSLDLKIVAHHGRFLRQRVEEGMLDRPLHGDPGLRALGHMERRQHLRGATEAPAGKKRRGASDFGEHGRFAAEGVEADQGQASSHRGDHG